MKSDVSVTGLPRTSDGLQFSDVLRALGRDLAPLTIVRAPRGYGKTSLVALWFGAGTGLEREHYVSLRDSARTDSGFWRALAQELGTDPELGRAGIQEALAVAAERTLLVIDNYQLAGRDEDLGTVDGELIDLIRDFQNFYVVVLTRVLRPIEALGTMSLPARVIGPAELALDVERAKLLAADLDMQLVELDAVSLIGDVSGWPAVVRTALGQAAFTGEPPRVDPTALAGHLETVIADFEAPSMGEFLMRISVTEEVTPDVARILMGDGSGAILMRQAHAAGLLQLTSERSGYRIPGAIQRTLYDLMRANNPEYGIHTHQLLSEQSAGVQEPLEVLQRTVAAGNWDSAVNIFEESFAPFLTLYPGEVLELIRQFPTEAQRTSAYVRVALEELPGVPPAEAKLRDVPWSAAEVYGAQVENTIRTLGGGLDLGTLLLKWGLSAALSGRLDMATYILGRVRSRANDQPDHVVTGTAVLAAIHAYQGEIIQAQQWLNILAEEADGHERIGTGVVATCLAFAEAMTRIDAGDLRAADYLSGAPEPKYRDTLWALMIFAMAHLRLMQADPKQIVANVNELRAALRYVTRESLSEIILLSALIDLLIEVPMLTMARELVGRLGAHELGIMARAKLALAENDFVEAQNYANRVPDSLAQSPRMRVERDLILVSAAHGIGDFMAAERYFGDLVQSVSATGQRGPLVRLPAYLFRVFAKEDKAILGLWPQSGTDLGASQWVDQLTPREVQVMRCLTYLPGPAGIATEVGLSANTVKTHVQAIYRKLQVSSRAEAVMIVEGGLG